MPPSDDEPEGIRFFLLNDSVGLEPKPVVENVRVAGFATGSGISSVQRLDGVRWNGGCSYTVGIRMIHIKHQMAATVVNQLQSRFDAHDVERRILRLYTVPIASELLEFRNATDPLQQFSAAFAKWIDRSLRGRFGRLARLPLRISEANCRRTRSGKRSTQERRSREETY
jgi:hypothetical protein